MDKPKSSLYFKIMVLAFKLRDLLSPRGDILAEANIKPGFCVLDYGCGPGGYILGTAELVGESGTIHALDIHSSATRRAAGIASKNRLSNVKTIQSDCETGLADGSVDVVLMYDVFHDLCEPDKVLKELHRVLRPEGTLSFSDHHLKESTIVAKITKAGLFKLSDKGRKTHTFTKA